MTAFEDLKSQWENQAKSEIPKDGAKQILKKITSVRKKQVITNIVLTATGLVLVAFFFYVSAYKFQTVMIGLFLMIGALVLRIGLEFSSIRTLKNLNVSTSAEKFKKQMIRYYMKRKKVHFVLTPIIILVYCIGFLMLLPAFKESLSSGFYNYVVVSSMVLLIVLSIFIAREVWKELAILKELKD
ncbi:hypothetical protein FEE95_05600 [Maribacter algarum]|uniref:Uncharacterized protein n=1 Tax=Maribacter algarum (ex Zhang et al. 2020) TaxID=2578118 RepID=A0A5S3PV70_9FLAO|nr:hypothetical protein [Maribacter algarum]TMM58906.1 hypothetical protein FEE95_05600 [Maribacter algarum]